MGIQVSFVDTHDFEMREGNTPVVLSFEAPPRPPHLASYQHFTDGDGDGSRCIDGHTFNDLERHRGRTLWVWRITGGTAPLASLEGCWAQAHIETYPDQVMRLEGCLSAEREMVKGLETLIDKAADLAFVTDRPRRPSHADAKILDAVLLRAAQKANRGFGLYASLSNRLAERMGTKKAKRP